MSETKKAGSDRAIADAAKRSLGHWQAEAGRVLMNEMDDIPHNAKYKQRIYGKIQVLKGVVLHGARDRDFEILGL